MEREEEILKAATHYANHLEDVPITDDFSRNLAIALGQAFIKGCEWADAHPKNLYCYPDKQEVTDMTEEQKVEKYCKYICKGYQQTGRCFADGRCESFRKYFNDKE